MLDTLASRVCRAVVLPQHANRIWTEIGLNAHYSRVKCFYGQIGAHLTMQSNHVKVFCA